MRLPKVGPRLAAPPTDLDDDSMERLDEFVRLTGGEAVVSTRRLLWLGVVFAGRLQLRDDHKPKSARETVILTPHTIVMTPQQLVGVAKVNYYLAELSSGKSIKPARVLAVGEDDGWWHLDGLHRLLAVRILGRDLEAKVWR